MKLLIILAFYLLGVFVAKLLYRFGKFNQDREVVYWSWIGAFVILLSINGSNYNR